MSRIIGTGQLAKAFEGLGLDNVIVFASGVADSNCTDVKEFAREEKLLLETLYCYKDSKVVYFSSCALSANNYEMNDYYLHKSNMESLIKEHSNNYYIFRLPQLFGPLKAHQTLINFLYNAIENNTQFNLIESAYRYVIEIKDVRNLVEAFLKYSNSCITIDLANTYRYSVLQIVKVLEKVLNKQANYDLIPKEDGYLLSLDELEAFIKNHNIDINFSKDYFEEKLRLVVDN